MTDAFLEAVLDTILPSEAGMGLPSGSAAGLGLGRQDAAAGPVLRIVLAAAGGEESFLGASAEDRRATLEAAERQAPEAFRALLAALLPDYYECEAVLNAFGWRADPPQPQGHRLAGTDEAIGKALERVRRRGKIWRSPVR
ncbi:MAG TPA: hypothetical protein VN821_05555 [Candidatus Udaeobacter sp.]|nr:hypothetical protein [Candidatus Udaeobacter sp.]